MNNIFKYQLLSKRGFTLVELLMSISIFIIFALIIINIYFSSMDRHIVALQVQTVNEELRYAMEVMARDIKDSYVMASGTEPIIYLYHPTKNFNNSECTTSGFLGCLQYKYNSVDKRIEVKGKDDSNFVPLTSSNIEVEKLIFNIDATGGNASDQPKVTILIKAKEKKDSKGQSETSIQTTVNQKETINLYQGTLNP